MSKVKTEMKALSSSWCVCVFYQYLVLETLAYIEYNLVDNWSLRMPETDNPPINTQKYGKPTNQRINHGIDNGWRDWRIDAVGLDGIVWPWKHFLVDRGSLLILIGRQESNPQQLARAPQDGSIGTIQHRLQWNGRIPGALLKGPSEKQPRQLKMWTADLHLPLNMCVKTHMYPTKQQDASIYCIH